MQPLALIILELGMIKVAASSRSSKKYVIKLLRFESRKITFLCLLWKGSIFKPKKNCIKNGLKTFFLSCSHIFSFFYVRSPFFFLQESFERSYVIGNLATATLEKRDIALGISPRVVWLIPRKVGPISSLPGARTNLKVPQVPKLRPPTESLTYKICAWQNMEITNCREN